LGDEPGTVYNPRRLELIGNNPRLLRTIALLLIMAMAGIACGRGDDGDGDASGLTGTVSGDGSSTVFPLTEAVAEEFQKENPDVQVTVGTSGTGGGFEKFCNDEIDIADASRPIKDSEKQACEAKGVEYVELTVASDGLAVLANPQNDWAECLTTAELKRIWEPDSKINNWRDVRTGFPNQPLKLFGPGTDSGTFDFFTAEINGEEAASRTDYTASEDDNVLVQGVEGDEGALGYFGYAYFQENQDRLKLLGVDSGNGCVKPSDETVRDGTYAPLARPLLIYVKKSSLTRPEIKGFVDFYLANIGALAGDVGYTALSDEDLQTEIDELAAAGGATP
jgi:phosphate transport system substrate-binding protein